MKMLKFAEVAEQLSCSISNIYSLVQSGELLATSTGAGGKGFRVSEEDLAVFLEKRKKRLAVERLDLRRSSSQKMPRDRSGGRVSDYS
jgi:excisionase family DNA binding protein